MSNQLNQFIFESMREEFDYTSGRLDIYFIKITYART